MNYTAKEKKAKGRLCLRLNSTNPLESVEYAKKLRDFFGLYKIETDLYLASSTIDFPIGEEISRINGFPERNIFIGLNFHDNHDQVYGAARSISLKPYTRMFSVHVRGGKEMCQDAVRGSKDAHNYLRGLYDSKERSELERAKVIGVTELRVDERDLDERAALGLHNERVRVNTKCAKAWGLDGVICPAAMVRSLQKEFGSSPDFIYIGTGIEYRGNQERNDRQPHPLETCVTDSKNSILVMSAAIKMARNQELVASKMLKIVARAV